jgi:hypothetical protein
MLTTIGGGTHRGIGRLAAGVLAGCLLLALAAPVLADIRVPKGTRVRLEFAESLDSHVAKKGDIVRLRALQDVFVGGERVIARGARSTGQITSVRKPRRFGRRAEITIDLTGVRAVDGREIPLERYRTGDRYTAGGAAAASGGLIVLGPIGAAAGAFVKGKHIKVEAGTAIDAAVAADVNVRR